MTDKKEVLDYLRNLQKGAEIEAKVNGINIWVLLGAIAVVGWQLTAQSALKLLSDFELTSRVLIVAVALHILSWLFKRSTEAHDELRYSRSSLLETDSAVLVLSKGMLITLPAAMLWFLAGASIGVVAASAIGVVLIVVGFVSIFKPVFFNLTEVKKFPRPEFELSRKGSLVGDILFGFAFIYTIVEQVAYMRSIQRIGSVEDVRSMLLLVAFYLLLLITITRKQHIGSIAWTYDLEADLVLGSVAPDVALRKIENRRLGPRLQDVMDRFFDDLDRQCDELDSLLAQGVEKMKDANQVPIQYPAERAARLREATAAISRKLEDIRTDCKEFQDYLTTLEQRPAGGRKALLAPLLLGLRARYETYEDRLNTAKLELRRLTA